MADGPGRLSRGRRTEAGMGIHQPGKASHAHAGLVPDHQPDLVSRLASAQALNPRTPRHSCVSPISNWQDF